VASPGVHHAAHVAASLQAHIDPVGGRLVAQMNEFAFAVRHHVITAAAATAGVPQESFATKIQNFFLSWNPVFTALFMFAVIFLLVRLMKMMPRTKPVQIKPDANLEVGWGEIAGIDEAKSEVREVVDFLREPDRFKAIGAKVPRGVLLHGPPGTGKTLLAKAAAHESGVNFFGQSASSFVEMFAGLGAVRIRRLFREARKNAPAIIFIDELDAVGAKRGSDSNSEREQTLNQLLVEMDGFDSSEQIVVMAASNLLEKLDDALMRPGRFDRQIYVSPPDVKGRERVLEVHTRGKPLGDDVDLGLVAQQTSGLTGADLANICNEAAIRAARTGSETLRREDFDAALERVVAGVQSNTTLNDHERQVVAYHEAGHALCRELLSTADRVHKISIVPRGQALGYVMNLPDEDSYLKTREELIDQLTVLLGGRVAEEIVFGQISTGAASDLQRVSEITYAMVHDYGMGSRSSAPRALPANVPTSDQTMRVRDEEEQELVFEAHRMAHELIEGRFEKLEEFAQALLAHEVLERPEIDEIMAGVPKMDRRPAPPQIGIAAAAKQPKRKS
jgi:cell division protease FtsH